MYCGSPVHCLDESCVLARVKERKSLLQFNWLPIWNPGSLIVLDY
jgi:hypothetical protein